MAICLRKKVLIKMALCWAIFLLFTGLFSGCVSKIPVEEYTIARSAMDSARQCAAPRYASGVWFQAEQAYQKGEKLFQDREYDQSHIYFLRAKILAEKAENTARYERAQNGDFDL